jgi:hypothetical protein
LSPIKFPCKCGQTLRVPDERAGLPVQCPSCNAIMTAPGTPPDKEEEQKAPPPTATQKVVGTVREQIARSMERAPQLTRMAVALGGWAIAVLVLGFLISVINWSSYYFSIWLFVWLPLAAAGGFLAWWMLQARPSTPKMAEMFCPLVVGADWVVFIQSIMTGEAAGYGLTGFLVTLMALSGLAGFGFLYFHLRRQDTRLLFVEQTGEEEAPAEAVETPDQKDEPKTL